jgi:hypothetical protein
LLQETSDHPRALCEIIKSNNMSQESLEKIFSSYAEKDKILEKFKDEKRAIEEMTGLKLSNIEAVGLRKITEEVMKQMSDEAVGGINGHTMVAPFEEIPARFFQKFFDIDIDTYINLPRDGSGDFDEVTKQWFKREQEKRCDI